MGVLFVNEENYIGLLQDRIKGLTKEKDLHIEFFNNIGIKLDEEIITLELMEYCKDKKIGFIIFDSLTRIHNLDENTSNDMRRLYDYFKIFTKENISVLFTHHHRKRGPNEWKPNNLENMRGSSELGAQIDTNLSIEVNKESLILHKLKQRSNLLLDPIYMKLVEKDGLYDFEYSDLIKREAMKDSEYTERIFTIIKQNPGITQKEIKGKAKIDAQSSLSRYLAKLEETGEIYIDGERPKRYFENSGKEVLF